MNPSARFNHEIFKLLRRIVIQHWAKPVWVFRLLKMIAVQAAAARKRRRQKEYSVPPLMIVSVTQQCNLSCQGCYSQSLKECGSAPQAPEMTNADLRRILAEARDLGISIIFLAGGEPLTRPGLLDVLADFPHLLFLLFTNGTLLDSKTINRLATMRQVIPIISLEGMETETDTRRGSGVFAKIQPALDELHKRNLLWGSSLTATSQNLGTLAGEDLARYLTGLGSCLFFWVEYVPINPKTADWTLSVPQRQALVKTAEKMQARFPAAFVAFPGDESIYGGCLAAGRGFIHVNASGQLEACPFAPFSDADLKHKPLAQALQSRLLAKLREHHDLLKETQGGCALWANRDFVESLME